MPQVCPLLTDNPILGMGLFILLLIWSAVWKGIALWNAGRNNQIGWFIPIFILNTAGILEIIYIFAFRKKNRNTSINQA